MSEIKKTYKFLTSEITISTGKFANLANGAVMLQMGGTTLFAVTTIDKKETEQDFLPLSIEYIEKLYARGAISGSKYKKREGLPSEEAIIKARQVDHSIRSLFPKSFKKPTSVVLTVLTYDQVNDPEALAVLGASLSVMLSKAPYYGPSSSVVACINKTNDVLLNPQADAHESLAGEFLMSGVDNKLLNIEGWGDELPESAMEILLDKSAQSINELNKIQRDFYKEATGEDFKTPNEQENSEDLDLPAQKELIEFIKHDYYDKITESVFQPERADRYEMISKIRNDVSEKLKSENLPENITPEIVAKLKGNEIDLALDYVARKILRESILKSNKRRLGRGLNQVRELKSEIDVLPTVHGSALFSRGLTQSLSIVTLGPKSSELLLEEMEGESTKNFMHHYNMPSYSTGEAGRFNYHPGRREIGHGAIGENALKKMMPSPEEFPYTIRVVSEIMTSNGSTSMAATCASSMALMAAGVPLKEAVGGISIGLISSPEGEYKLITDIEGIEDFYGDMDFKVTGTKNGVTAIQYENKLRGVDLSILKEAFGLAKTARMEVLDVMNSAISIPRKELSPNAPVVETVQIQVDQIGGLIGPGGKNIRDLIARSKEFAKSPADVAVEDSGIVTITAFNKAQIDFVKTEIEEMFGEAVVGKTYKGYVDKIMPYGIFINVNASVSGLCHISDIFEKRMNTDLTRVFKEGEEINAVVNRIDDGRVNFSIKGVEQSQDLLERIKNAPVVEQNYSNNRDFGNNRDRGSRERSYR